MIHIVHYYLDCWIDAPWAFVHCVFMQLLPSISVWARLQATFDPLGSETCRKQKCPLGIVIDSYALCVTSAK